MKRRLGLLALGLVVPLALTACGSDSSSDSSAGGEGGSSEISYWLWDSGQQPAYQKCADAFQAANPGLTVKIDQYGWGDYWTKLTTGFVSGTAPDVFTDHLQKYPEFAKQGQLVALDDLIKQDNVDLTQYAEGLADIWKGTDGKQYGLPKDFDTVAIFYNKDMTAAAGVTQEQLDTMEWNPTDGGTYEETIAKLTVDANGVHGDQPGFDKTNVKTYGLGLSGSGGGLGQTEYAMYTGSNGWTATDELWATQYHYDDPKYQESHRLVAIVDREGLHADVGEDRRRRSQSAVRGGKLRDGHGRVLEYRTFHVDERHRHRYRPHTHRSGRPPGEHVQRSRRLDLGRLGQPGQRLEVGQVPGVGRLPEHRR